MPFLMNDKTQPSSAQAEAEAPVILPALPNRFTSLPDGMPVYTDDQMRAYARAAIAAQPAPALEHIYAGDCPDRHQPDARDPECPACRQMMAAAQTAPDARPVAWAIEHTDGRITYHSALEYPAAYRDTRVNEWPLYAAAHAQQPAGLTDALPVLKRAADWMRDKSMCCALRGIACRCSGDCSVIAVHKEVTATIAAIEAERGIPAPTTEKQPINPQPNGGYPGCDYCTCPPGICAQNATPAPTTDTGEQQR